MDTIRLLVVDDDARLCQTLSRLLGRADDIDVIGFENDGWSAIDVVARQRPDVVIMDLRMPGLGGAPATAEIVQRWPRTRVLVLTTFGELDDVLPALHAGASGYLLKGQKSDEMLTAVRAVHGGTAVLSPRVSQLLVATAARKPTIPPSAGAEPLTTREQELVQLLAAGNSNHEIAAAMHITEATVKTHFTHIMVKWEVRDRVQVLIHAAKTGLVRID